MQDARRIVLTVGDANLLAITSNGRLPARHLTANRAEAGIDLTPFDVSFKGNLRSPGAHSGGRLALLQFISN